MSSPSNAEIVVLIVEDESMLRAFAVELVQEMSFAVVGRER
jgi:hypothetical protein